jgi:hypothetical protein
MFSNETITPIQGPLHSHSISSSACPHSASTSLAFSAHGARTFTRTSPETPRPCLRFAILRRHGCRPQCAPSSSRSAATASCRLTVRSSPTDPRRHPGVDRRPTSSRHPPPLPPPLPTPRHRLAASSPRPPLPHSLPAWGLRHPDPALRAWGVISTEGEEGEGRGRRGGGR